MLKQGLQAFYLGLKKSEEPFKAIVNVGNNLPDDLTLEISEEYSGEILPGELIVVLSDDWYVEEKTNELFSVTLYLGSATAFQGYYIPRSGGIVEEAVDSAKAIFRQESTGKVISVL